MTRRAHRRETAALASASCATSPPVQPVQLPLAGAPPAPPTNLRSCCLRCRSPGLCKLCCLHCRRRSAHRPCQLRAQHLQLLRASLLESHWKGSNKWHL